MLDYGDDKIAYNDILSFKEDKILMNKMNYS